MRTADSLGYTATFLLPLVQAPPRAVWGKTTAAKWLNAETMLGAPVEWDADPGEVVLRYLRAFGPAASKDVRAWCYRTGLARGDRRPAPAASRRFGPRRARSSTTSRTGSSPIRTRPRRCASCPSTTTRSSASRTARGSRRRPTESGRTGRARCWWMDSRRGRGASIAAAKSVAIEVGPWRKLTRPEREEVEAEAAALLDWAEPAAEPKCESSRAI